MKLWDISPVMTTKLAVWPGDTPLRREVLCDIKAGSNIDLSTLHATVHLGAHVDAPRHYHRDGVTMESANLEAYLGPCYVHSVKGKPLIEPEDCLVPLNSGLKRLLFHTGSYPDPDIFNQNFAAFAPESIDLLGKAGVMLVGIDTPSVDPFDSKNLPAHQMLYHHKMANLEGIILREVPDGVYELIALPLRLANFDASPVRAVLRRV